ncbi:MAG: methylthioribulose 1-phosphate dehydratase [Nitrospirae bacterium]|nr:methylthioribulose 1-phosphate dehydratase [Nitrospirota bacterium]
MKNYKKELRLLAGVKTDFASRGWMMATSGNFSLKVKESPLQFFISVSGRDKSINLPDDFILVNEWGESLELKKKPGTKVVRKPSVEAGIHAEIYKKRTAGIVLHVHTLYNTFISKHFRGKGVLIEGLEMIKGLGRWEENCRVKIPIVPNFHDLAELASGVAKSIDPAVPGILIEGHGLYAWGKTLHEAKRNVEAFEFLFQYSVLENQLMKGVKNG